MANAWHPTFAEIMEARGDHEGHGPQWQVGWLGHSGAFYPNTLREVDVQANERGGYMPVYVDADPT